MSDFSNNKPNNAGGMYPLQHERDLTGTSGDVGSGFTRVEPWLTVEKMKAEYLFGVPLFSPVTRQQLTDDTIKNIIAKAAAKVELQCKIDIFPVVRTTRQAFDRTKMQQGFNQLDLKSRNVREIMEVSIRAPASYYTLNGVVQNNTVDTADGYLLYKIPLEWIDTSLMHKGMLHFVPLQSSMNGQIPGGIIGGASAPLMQILTQISTIPGYWFCRFNCGFSENSIPSIVNDLIATYATMDILSMLGPTNKWNSQSIGLDGASQGLSGPGNQIFALRQQELGAKAEDLAQTIKAYFGVKFMMKHI
jgi:hypothetical protein